METNLTPSRKWSRWLAGLAIGALFTWLSARGWPMDKLFGGTLVLGTLHDTLSLYLRQKNTDQVMWSVKLWSLGAYFLVLSLIHWLRVLRQKPLLAPYALVPLAELNRTGAIGFMSVFLLPLRLGEFVRPLLLTREGTTKASDGTQLGGGVPFGASLASVALERVMDGLLVSALLFAVLMEVPDATIERFPEVRLGAWAALGVFGGALLALGCTLLARAWTIRMVTLVFGKISPNLAQKLVTLLTAFVDGLKLLQSPWHVGQFLGLTLVYWAVNGVGIYTIAHGFGLDVPMVGAYAMVACVVVGMMIPNSPGNVGSFWYFLLLPAGLWGVRSDTPAAIAFGLGVWLMQTLQVTSFGIWGTWADARVRKRRGLQVT